MPFNSIIKLYMNIVVFLVNNVLCTYIMYMYATVLINFDALYIQDTCSYVYIAKWQLYR